MVYYSGEAALKYEVYEDEKVVAVSDENTLSRISPTYKNGYNKMLTGSIGCSFLYDMKNEDTNPSYSSNKIMNKSKIMQDSYCKNSFFGVSYYITHFT